jgi:hypothetical protein
MKTILILVFISAITCLIKFKRKPKKLIVLNNKKFNIWRD